MLQTLVIDCYHGNTIGDLHAAKASGLVGIIHKASQGSTMVDLAYAGRRKLAREAGLLWGAYHFFDFGNPEHQADHFLSVAEPDDETLVALDWENIGRGAPTSAQAMLFLEQIMTKLGRRAVIYSGNVAKEQIHGADQFFGDHRLWLAQYGARWQVQASWTRPWLWQFSETGRFPGFPEKSDCNTIVEPMTVEQLTEEWAL